MFKILCIFLTVSQIYAISPTGDVVGQVTVGYQGWFTAQGDGSPRGIWYHWSNNVVPSPGHETFQNWPDVSEYTNLFQTNYANLGNGQPARLFSSWDDQAVQTHFRWMSEYGIHTAALQRFGGVGHDNSERDFINGVAERAIRYAEQYGVKVYAMYDVSGWTNFQQELKDDFDNTVRNWFSSPAYARQNDKPVVCIWGLGFLDRPGDPGTALDVINHIKSSGVYVIGGIPRDWRTPSWSHTDFGDVYLAYDMLSPWTVGGFDGVNGALGYKDLAQADFEYCEQHGIDFQPVVFAGFAWSNFNDGPPNQIPRLGGDFMWRQFLNLRELGLPTAYVAMFDEFDEGTAIAKTAPTKNDAPPDQYFYTLDEDGIQMSSDFYLRLVNDGGRLIRGEISATDQKPTPYFA